MTFNKCSGSLCQSVEHRTGCWGPTPTAQTNKVAAYRRGEDIEGDTAERWNVFLFLCLANGSYFHPLSCTRADIAPDL